MSPLYDYRCGGKCRKTFEAYATPEQKRVVCPMCQEGYAERVYLRMAALPGRNKGRYPVFDQQLGCVVESSQHRDRIAKERGLVAMGPQELKRSIDNHHYTHPWDRDEVDADLVEEAQRVWDDVKFGRAPIHKESLPPDLTQADFLDASTIKTSS